MPETSSLELAKQGNPKEIAALLSQELAVKNIHVKASLQNLCLTVIAQSDDVPDQEPLVRYLRSRLTKLHPHGVSKVIIQGSASERTTFAWRDSFELEPLAPIPPEAPMLQGGFTQNPNNQPEQSSKLGVNGFRVNGFKGAENLLKQASALVQGRNAERIGLIVGTFLLTSGLWAGVGILTRSSSQPDKFLPEQSQPSPAPILTSPSPTFQQPTPIPTTSPPAAKQTTSTPAAKKSTPAPAVKKSTPAPGVKKTTPAPKKSTPTVKKSSPTVKKSSPTVKKPAPAPKKSTSATKPSSAKN
ncbi:MAG: hypothetical protein VKJ46_08155 [Leptolyngbyaceae bacterium]|nr:hypothetical protein [Leptolyngbyaceae bacterium]